MRALFLIIFMIVLAACGARPSTPPPPHQPIARQDPHRAQLPPPNPSGPSEAECNTLFDHVLVIAFAERQPPPSEGDQAAVRGELGPAFIGECRAGSRAYQQCGLAAKSRADLDACRATRL